MFGFGVQCAINRPLHLLQEITITGTTQQKSTSTLFPFLICYCYSPKPPWAKQLIALSFLLFRVWRDDAYFSKLTHTINSRVLKDPLCCILKTTVSIYSQAKYNFHRAVQTPKKRISVLPYISLYTSTSPWWLRAVSSSADSFFCHFLNRVPAGNGPCPVNALQ